MSDDAYRDVFNSGYEKGHEHGFERGREFAQEEIDRLKSLAYLVDQRNEEGIGNLISYKDAYLSLEQTFNSMKR